MPKALTQRTITTHYLLLTLLRYLTAIAVDPSLASGLRTVVHTSSSVCVGIFLLGFWNFSYIQGML